MSPIGAWLRRVVRGAAGKDTSDSELQGALWEVGSRRVDQAEFFRALAELVPAEAILVLEGGVHPPRLKRLVETNSVPARVSVVRGSPRAPMRYLPATAKILLDVAAAAEGCAGPELCEHLHVYDDGGVLLQWHDAFDDPFYISKRLPLQQVERFCTRLNASLRTATPPTS